MLTTQEVADRLKVGQSSVEEWVAEGELGSFKKGGRRRVSEQALEEFVLVHSLKPKRPVWLTRELEEQFWKRIDERIKNQVLSLQSTVHSQVGERSQTAATLEKAA